MINLTPTQVGGIATLMVMFEITNQAETQRVINQLNQIAKLNGITVNINLKTKSGSSKAMATKSMIKPPVIPDMAVSGVLEAADSAIPNLEWYKSNPVGKPYRARIQSAQSPMRQIVQSEFQKRDKQLATHGRPTFETPEFKRPYYEMIDFWATANGWTNTITNVDAEAGANLTSDHVLLIAPFKVNLAKTMSNMRSPLARDVLFLILFILN